MVTARRRVLGGDGSGDGVWVHCISRCVRRAFLCGGSAEHRKDWVEQRLQLIAEHAACEVAGYAVMSNHLHAVLRVRSELARDWSEHEVARRWLTLWPKERDANGHGLPPSIEHIEQAVEDQKTSLWRSRLANLGWCMKALKEDLARRANREDGCSGVFWDGRYKSVPLLDQAALIACMVYVDLNPLRAAIVQRPEDSTHTGIRTRIEAQRRQRGSSASSIPQPAATNNGTHQQSRLPLGQADSSPIGELEQPSWLTPLPCCVVGPRDGPDAVPDSSFSFHDYLLLIDATARILCSRDKAVMAENTLPILQRLRVSDDAWMRSMRGQRQFMGHGIGATAARMAAATLRGLHWVQNRCALFAKEKSTPPLP